MNNKFNIIKVVKSYLRKIYFFLVYWTFYLLLPKKSICLVLADSSSAYKNLFVVWEAMKKDEFLSSKLKTITSSDNIFKQIMEIASSKIVLLDQTSSILSNLQLGKQNICIQIWHGGGLYKKVGFDACRKNFSEDEEIKRISRIHRNIDYFVISDEKLKNDYANIFRIPVEHILPFGLPRTDNLITRDYQIDRVQLEEMFPEIKEKKVILYAPTFRKHNKSQRYHECLFDFDFFKKELGDEYVVAFRKHPTITESVFEQYKGTYIDFSSLDNDFCLSVADILITDYSSILFDYSLLNRPIFLFVPDLEKYQIEERQLYIPPKELVGDKHVFFNTLGIIKILKNKDHEIAISSIKERFMGSCDSKATSRILDFILNLLK